MADTSKVTDGPSVASDAAYDFHNLPDWDNKLYVEDDILAFASALAAPETSPSEEDLTNPTRTNTEFITALNDWRPIHQRVRDKDGRKAKRAKKPRRGKDETREGWTYNVLKYPFLITVFGWLGILSVIYLLTRLYIWLYEHYVSWTGTRKRLRTRLRNQTSYEDWVKEAKELDRFLGNDPWKEDDEYAYYDSRTIKRVQVQMRKLRLIAEKQENDPQQPQTNALRPIDNLRGLAEACVKNNFAGFENVRLYSETYYGTKNLVQDFIDEAATTLKFLLSSKQLTGDEKRRLSKHLSTNFGRTALCLSGGATFAYYHFGIAKALLDADLLPTIITGTSGGALIASLLTTRTDEELKKLLIPALAYKIDACREGFSTWFPRWWRTGARFDSIDWAKRCSWFCNGSLTFLEAYERTGRILNVSCVPSDPHSPTILANYLTAPDCVIWSAVLASAAVPGVLNPVVLMRKTKDRSLEPYSFGHKWKDGSLRTDIPLKSLNLHFNVNFSIVSQVNPHINLFFFSARGNVGRPVTHRRGRGWRGGFLGSAIEQYVKLDLTKWLKVLRQLELLPRPLGQDWSEVWLQQFSGTITMWPKSVASDYWNILSDPSMQRLARMIHVGQLAAWPNLNFIANRMALEKVIEDGRKTNRPPNQPLPTPLPDPKTLRSMFSQEDIKILLARAKAADEEANDSPDEIQPADIDKVHTNGMTALERTDSPSFSKRVTSWFNKRSSSPSDLDKAYSTGRRSRSLQPWRMERRGSNIFTELKRQSTVFWDDTDPDYSNDEDDKTSTSDELNGQHHEIYETGPVSIDTEQHEKDGQEVDRLLRRIQRTTAAKKD